MVTLSTQAEVQCDNRHHSQITSVDRMHYWDCSPLINRLPKERAINLLFDYHELVVIFMPWINQHFRNMAFTQLLYFESWQNTLPDSHKLYVEIPISKGRLIEIWKVNLTNR